MEKSAFRDVMRPEFLMNVMGCSPSTVTMPDMRTALHDSSVECQLAYTTLMNANIQKREMASVHCDGGAVVMRASSKSSANRIGECCSDRVLRRGNDRYSLSVKVRDEYVIVSCVKHKNDTESE